MHGPLLATRRWLLLTLRCRRRWPLALLVLLPLLPVGGRLEAQEVQAATSLQFSAVRQQAERDTTRPAQTVDPPTPPPRPDGVRVPVPPACSLLRIRGPPMG